MNINFSYFNLNNVNHSVNQRQDMLHALLNKKSTFGSHGQDTFTKSADVPNSLGVYSTYKGCTSKKISDTILSIMNNDISKVKMSGDVFECGGICFTANQIPKIDCSSLSEVQAENNVLDIGRNKYFKYVSSDGREHSLYTDNKGIGSIVSEIMCGEPYDAAVERYASFWNYSMTEDPVYIGLNYSDDQIRNYMSEPGVSYGFFTVKMGDREATQFYSATETTSPIQVKERYDMRYQHLTSGGVLLDEYEPGSVFKIGDKEYVLSENHTLDIPYGEDIYNLQYPSSYRFGEKIY